MYRLYVDEVGTDDLNNLDEDNFRFLSLTGVAMRIPDARDDLTPKMDWIKAHIFDHDPDDPLIFHRSDIRKKKRQFGVLNDAEKHDLFDRSILRLMQSTDYRVISALLDKRGMMNQPHWVNKHPYHYLMQILVEKYTQFLERMDSTGDIMPEGRKGKKDQALQAAYEKVRAEGTYYVPSDRMKAAIPFDNLKFRYKPQNISGLQLCDLLAHPSHIFIRERMQHQVQQGDFCKKVTYILTSKKYDRGANGSIIGYGAKWLP